MARTKQGARPTYRTIYGGRRAPPPPPQPVLRKSARTAAKTAAAATAAANAAAAAATQKSVRNKRPVTVAHSSASAAAAAAASANHALVAQQLHAANSKAADLTRQLQTARAEFDAARRLHQNQMELTLQEEVLRLHAQHQQRIKEAQQATTQVDRMEESNEETSASSATSSASAGASSSSSSSSAAWTDCSSPFSLPPCPLPLPSHWPSTQAHTVSLQSVARDHPDFLMIQNMLHVNRGLDPSRSDLLHVQRVFNRPLWERYAAARHRLMRKAGNESLRCAESMGNEQLLFHGTRNNQPHLIYATADGFDVRMAGNGMFGPGLYFSRDASYSGQSYAHPLQAQAYGYGHSYGGHPQPYQSPIPPIFSACPKSGLKAEPIPADSFQMFIARVALGTTYDARKLGAPANGYHGARAPLRPFHCPQCAKKVDLHQLNIEAIKDDLLAGCASASAAAAATDAAEPQDEALGDTVPANAQANRGKRKRSAVKAKAPTQPVAAAAAAASPVASGAPASSASAAEAFTPRKTRRQMAMATSAATAAVPAVAPTAPSTPSLPLTPVAVTTAAAAGSSAATTSNSSVADLASLASLASAASTVAAAAPAASASAAAAAPPSFDSHPVSCPSCSCCLGTRASLLAHPYRYDSVTSDHMSITYDSACAYPEFLITYTYGKAAALK